MLLVVLFHVHHVAPLRVCYFTSNIVMATLLLSDSFKIKPLLSYPTLIKQLLD